MKPLTPRERAVAELVAKGMPNKVIASELGITERTVDAHLAHAAMRLGGDGTPRYRVTVWFYQLEEAS